MAYSEKLSKRIEDILKPHDGITKKKMFGGICFLHYGNMLCGINEDKLMARVGPDKYEDCLEYTYCTEMNFTGKPMKGMVYVSEQGIKSKESLNKWINLCMKFVGSLPKK